MTCVVDDLVRASDSVTKFSNFNLLLVALDGCSNHNNITRFQDNKVSRIIYPFCMGGLTVLNKNLKIEEEKWREESISLRNSSVA